MTDKQQQLPWWEEFYGESCFIDAVGFPDEAQTAKEVQFISILGGQAFWFRYWFRYGFAYSTQVAYSTQAPSPPFSVYKIRKKATERKWLIRHSSIRNSQNWWGLKSPFNFSIRNS